MKVSRNNKSGMTLVEILLAIFISTMVFLAITSIHMLGQRYFRIGSDRLEIVQNGRITLDRLTRELRQTEEIVTLLPETKTEPSFPPSSEIQFQDGHEIDTIRYFRYFLDGNQLNRQIIVYYFEGYEDEYVNWNAVREEGEVPLFSIIDQKLVGEFIEDLDFYGSNEINIEAVLSKDSVRTTLRTKIFGRNTQ